MASKWRVIKIGHGVKIPKSKNMVGIKIDSKSIQENIKNFEQIREKNSPIKKKSKRI